MVQFHAEAQVAHGHFTGRVEFLVSHQAVHFESLDALMAFIIQMVTEIPQGVACRTGRRCPVSAS